MNDPTMPKYVIEISSLHGLQFKIPIGGQEDLELSEQVIGYALNEVRKELRADANFGKRQGRQADGE